MRITASVTNTGSSQDVVVSTGGSARTLTVPAKAPGGGSAVNGGEFLMLALATCYCNDLYREAARLGIALDAVEVVAEAEFPGVGLAAERIRYRATVRSPESDERIAQLLRETDGVAEVHNTLRVPREVQLIPFMIIRRARVAECDALLECWLGSVQATHDFVSAEHVAAMVPEVRSYLSSDTAEIWVACDEAEAVMGFMGMSGAKMDALFVAPEFQGRGVGRRLVREAQTRHADLSVDVNEQNTAARRFYEACGFVVEGRSDLDDQGRPYPLLHLRLITPGRVLQPPATHGHT